MAKPDRAPYGSRKPLPVPRPTRAQLAAFLQGIKIGGPDECWLWSRYINESGYGHIKLARGCVYVHRLAYAVWYNDDLAGYTVDHTCQNRACCNPRHLKKLTFQENRALVDERRTLAEVPF